MNVFWREMKANRKSLIIWCIGILFMVISGMGKYTSLSSSGESMNDLMAQMPKSMQAMIGAGVFDLSKASGYYGVLYEYLLLMATIHAVLIGANIIAKEERDKTSEFLFVKPKSRRNIITSKLTAAFITILIFNLMTLISSLSIVTHYSNGEVGVPGVITRLMIVMFIIQLLFLVLGSGLAAIMKNPKKSSSTATGIMLITFILSIAIDLNQKLEFLKFLTPFKYFDPKEIMYGSGFDTINSFLSLVIIIALTSVTYIFFQKRDLRV